MDWKKEAQHLLDKLVKPIPLFVRPLAKKTIKKRIEEVAQDEQAKAIQEDHVLHGYILAAQNKNKERVKTFLDSINVDYSKYESLLG